MHKKIILLFSLAFLFACQTDSAVHDSSKANASVKAPIEHPFHDVSTGTLDTMSSLKVGEINRFTFNDWAGSELPVWIYIPSKVDVSNAPILIMLHGAKRGAHRYLREWRPLAEANGFIVVAPEFSTDDFPKAVGYNLGNVFVKEGVGLRDESLWSFSVIEPIFYNIVNALNSNQAQYTMFGHSAGSQFVHRYLYYKPNARVKRYIAANAGWYTLADATEIYPYGLNGSGVTQEQVNAALSKDVVILLGNKDNDSQHKSLRRTPEALRQGPHRYARGYTYYENAKSIAEKYQTPFNWRIQDVDGVAHSNSGMAAAAVKLSLIE